MRKKLRVLILMHPDVVPPEDPGKATDKEKLQWKTEYGIVKGLRKAGHQVKPLGVQHELLPIRIAVDEWKPHIVFNLLEEFHGEAVYDQNVVGYLELLRIPYSGCNPRGMVLSRGKALAKKMLTYHRILVPKFAVFQRGQRYRRARKFRYPVIVKSLVEHSSLGIAQASVVDNEEKLIERVKFVHDHVGTDAIVEEYIAGRELYVGVLGNRRLLVLPPFELIFRKMSENSLPIATAHVKHNPEYQKRHGIDLKAVIDLSPDQVRHVVHNSKRIFRILELDGYARIDYRLADDGKLYFLEANPNPDLAWDEEFALAAKHCGIAYGDLLRRILHLGLRRSP